MTKKQALQKAGKYLSEKIKKSKDKKLLLLSGGSAFEILPYLSKSILNPELSVTMLDDRFSTDPKINNFLQLKSTSFFKIAEKKATIFISSAPSEKSLGKYAENYQKNIKTWLNENPNGKIFATFGIGADGHTAGIFPEKNFKLFQKKYQGKMIVHHTVKNAPACSQRVTVSPSLIKKISASCGVVFGQEKKLILEKMKKRNTSPWQIPAKIWLKNKGSKIFFGN